MVEGYERLKELDAELLPLIGAGERQGEHLKLIFEMAHSELLRPNPASKEDQRLDSMKGFDYLCAHLSDPLSCEFILGLYGAMRGEKNPQWKRSNNYFEFDQGFYVTLPHDQTPQAMENLCRDFQHLNDPRPEDFQDIFRFLMHFICIHPLTNGNGRVYAFLFQFLLFKAGLHGAIYLPIDALVTRLYGDRTTLEIHRASGNYYGRKELDLSTYIPFMMDMLEKSYGLLISSLRMRG